jgi:hypothetical protein
VMNEPKAISIGDGNDVNMIAHYTSVSDDSMLERGPYSLTIYQHKLFPIVYEIRAYPDFLDATAHYFNGDRRFYVGKNVTRLNAGMMPFSAHNYLIKECTRKLVDFNSREAA